MKSRGCMICLGKRGVPVPLLQASCGGSGLIQNGLKPCPRCNPQPGEGPFFPTQLYPGGAARVHEQGEQHG